MCDVSHQLLQACRMLTNHAYESKQTWQMELDQLFSQDETGAGTLTMISAEMIGLLKEYVKKQESQVLSIETLKYVSIHLSNISVLSVS